MIYRHLVALMVFALAGMSAGIAASLQSPQAGEPVPQDLLDLAYQQCYRPCREGFEHKVCEPLCMCSIDRFKADLDYERYLTLIVGLAENAVRPEDRAYLDEVAGMCAAVLQESGVEVIPIPRDTPDGLPEPPK